MDNPFDSKDPAKTLNPFAKSSDTVNDPPVTSSVPPVSEPVVPLTSEELLVKSDEPVDTVDEAEQALINEANDRKLEIINRRNAEVEARKVERKKKQLILEEHGGLESNIPLNSEYWQLRF